MNNPELELKKIIFLCYVNRSGSTFLANTLSRSKDIMVFPEAEILVNLLLVKPEMGFNLHEEIENKIKTDSKLKYWGLAKEDLAILYNAKTNFDAFVKILLIYKNKFKPTATILLFKSERLIFLYEKITKYFAEQYNLLFVGLIRDPRAVYESQKRTEMSARGTYMSQNPVFTAISWNHFVKVLKSIKSWEDIFLIKYENLILRYEETCNVFCKLIGIKEFDFSAEGDLLERLPDDQRDKHRLVDNKPQKERINLWENRLGEKEIYLIEKYSQKKMNFLKYQPTIILKQRILMHNIVGYSYWAIYYVRMVVKKVLFRFNKIGI